MRKFVIQFQNTTHSLLFIPAEANQIYLFKSVYSFRKIISMIQLKDKRSRLYQLYQLY